MLARPELPRSDGIAHDPVSKVTQGFAAFLEQMLTRWCANGPTWLSPTRPTRLHDLAHYRMP
jgi:hypothetical protein